MTTDRDSLISRGAIDPSELSGSKYFESLISAATDRGVFSVEAAEKLQYELFELIAMKTEQYNGGFSSSIPTELARSLADGVAYTVGAALKRYATPEAALEALKNEKLSSIYADGKLSVESLLSSVRRMYPILVRTLPDTGNVTYSATVKDGILGFLKKYNPEYEPQETIITADYPTALPFPDLTGVEFIEEYVRRIYNENRFLSHFDAAEIRVLLEHCGQDSGELIFNVFSEVLKCSLGNELCGKNPLRPSPCTKSRLCEVFSGLTKAGIYDLLRSAATKLIDLMGLTNKGVCDYIFAALPAISTEIGAAVGLGDASRAFICRRTPTHAAQTVTVSFGNKMPDEKYRELIDRLEECESFSEKQAVIFEEVKSLGDFTDVVCDLFDLTVQQIAVLLSRLTPYELAALDKRLSDSNESDLSVLSDGEIRLRAAIDEYLSGQTEEYRARFSGLCDMIAIEDDAQ